MAGSLAIHGLAVLWLLPGQQRVPTESVRTGDVDVIIASLSTARAVEVVSPVEPELIQESKPPVRAVHKSQPQPQPRPSAALIEQKAVTPDAMGQAPGQGPHEPVEVNANQANVLADEGLSAALSRSNKVREGDMHRIRHHLEHYKFYPASARRRGIEGAVQVGFQLDGKGYAEDVSVLASSGYSLLDRAAKETVKRAEPFPAAGGDFRFTLQFHKL
ncbi:MAG: energy transducer TonB [Mariprofundaceae bacterium]